jgi:hypothetical protein
MVMTWRVLFSNPNPFAPNPRPPKGTPTDINLYVLDREITEGKGVIGLLPPTSIPHIRRCLKAGLLEPAGARGTWKLSPKGVEALEHWRATKP